MFLIIMLLNIECDSNLGMNSKKSICNNFLAASKCIKLKKAYFQAFLSFSKFLIPH